MSEQTANLACELPAEGRVWLHHARGTVRVLPAAGRRVSLDAEPVPGLRWEMDSTPDGDVRIRSLSEDATRPPAVDCTLALPAEARLRAHLLEGMLRLENVSIRTRIETVSADVVLEAARGAFHLQTVSGDILARGVEGSAYMQTVSGDVHLHACRITDMQVRALNGDLFIETPLLAGPYAFHTLSGEVVLRLPPETHCDLDFRTLSGGLKIAHSGVYFPRKGSRRRVMLGDGGPQVKVATLSGALWVMSAPRRATG